MNKRVYYVIKVDYYMWDSVKDDMYTAPLYLYTMRNEHKTYTFDETLNAKHYDLKWFATGQEALDFIKEKKWNDEPQCSFENARVEKVEY